MFNCKFLIPLRMIVDMTTTINGMTTFSLSRQQMIVVKAIEDGCQSNG